jgi:hypothetical protein
MIKERKGKITDQLGAHKPGLVHDRYRGLNPIENFFRFIEAVSQRVAAFFILAINFNYNLIIIKPWIRDNRQSEKANSGAGPPGLRKPGRGRTAPPPGGGG